MNYLTGKSVLQRLSQKLVPVVFSSPEIVKVDDEKVSSIATEEQVTVKQDENKAAPKAGEADDTATPKTSKARKVLQRLSRKNVTAESEKDSKSDSPEKQQEDEPAKKGAAKKKADQPPAKAPVMKQDETTKKAPAKKKPDVTSAEVPEKQQDDEPAKKIPAVEKPDAIYDKVPEREQDNESLKKVPSKQKADVPSFKVQEKAKYDVPTEKVSEIKAYASISTKESGLELDIKPETHPDRSDDTAAEPHVMSQEITLDQTVQNAPENIKPKSSLTETKKVSYPEPKTSSATVTKQKLSMERVNDPTVQAQQRLPHDPHGWVIDRSAQSSPWEVPVGVVEKRIITPRPTDR